MTAAPVTLLFTDLVDSTGLLRRVGDEGAQRILHAHRQLLREALASHGGREVKWLGDGVLTTFASVADGVRCAVTMAQRARRPVAGERLGLRLGLHVGEVLPDEADYVGTPVVLARRLCDRATAGQILCSGVVVELLRGRQGFTFAEVGPLELKGFPEPVAGNEVLYRPETGAALLRHTPFTGRIVELRRLTRRLEEARAGQGGVVLLAGEPGIGKTRIIEEIAATARAQGALVLSGRCYEGEAARSFGPFVEALAEYAGTAAPEVLRNDLGVHAATLTRLVPGVRARLPDTPDPAPLEPYEERLRLLDAVAQSLLALAARVPTVLVLDDLHWADAETVALLRHVARFAPRARLLVLGAYRDVEVAQHHPLTEALGTLPRETSYEQLSLGGLDAAAVKELVDAVTEREVPAAWVEALTEETSGNPFFVREVLLNLDQEGALASEGPSVPPKLEAPRPPDTVRQVIARRLERLSEATNRLLRVAAAFTGGIDFEVAHRVAGLDERAALDALDAALGTQLLAPASSHGHAYDFTHALVRHTLYEGLSPARQVRLHREIAEAIEAVYGDRAVEHAAAIARHYYQSASLPDAERGASWALTAADRAETACAFSDAADFLKIALALLPARDPSRPRLLARVGLAQSSAMEFEGALEAAREAATLIATTETRAAAAEYLAEVVQMMDLGDFHDGAFCLAEQGLECAGDRRDATWLVLVVMDIIRRETSDPCFPGIPLDSPERRAVSRACEALGSVPRLALPFYILPTRRDVLACAVPQPWRAGDYRGAVGLFRPLAIDAESRGQIAQAGAWWSNVFRFHTALGEFGEAREARERMAWAAARFTGGSFVLNNMTAAEDEWRMALDEWDQPWGDLGASTEPRMVRWYQALTQAAIARTYARLGRPDRALRRLETVIPAIERAPGWVEIYTRVVCDAAETLWLTRRTDWIDILERNLREKVIEPDFHFPMMDGRLALARLCSLQRRDDEAVEWFAKARTVLDEQGARPLRAIVDYDESLMYARRAAPGDASCAQPLLDAALEQFRALGMPGWIRRAEQLRATLAATRVATADTSPSAPRASDAEAGGVFRREGDVWVVTWAGTTVRLGDARGFAYLAVLLRHPGRELHATDVVRLAGGEQVGDSPRTPPDRELATSGDLGHAGTILDGRAHAAYRARLEELREELAEAEGLNDLGRVERCREEIAALVQQLSGAKRGRTAAAHGERARVAVTKGLKGALERIAASHPELGRHLTATVRRGYFCVYRPDPARPVHWDT